MNFLKLSRRILAAIFLFSITLLFLDFTGTIHSALHYVAKVQFIPAILSLNFIVIVALMLLTLLFGRLYCSVICPLGILQDVIAALSGGAKKKKYSYSPPLNIVRWVLLATFIICLFMGINSIVAILDPYSAYGRIVSNIFSPFYFAFNNLLAYISERLGSYLFYSKEIWIKSLWVLGVSFVTLITIIILAWKNGRTYCNVICPVGTFLGFFSKFSLFKHVINTDKCTNCTMCQRKCKASCIDATNHSIDYSRCVSCFNCIDSCKKGAISYKWVGFSKENKDSKEQSVDKVDSSRRTMLSASALLMATSALKAQEAKMDGGLAFIEGKKVPLRNTTILPAGAISHANFNKKCTACQLCVSVCPNGVLTPSDSLDTFMQPQATYERGYCRPECNKCSQVCPSGAINSISAEDKSSVQVGHAVWIEKNCVVITDGVSCGNCARHCPVGAIRMIKKEYNGEVKSIPMVNIERCIGCGACEYLCPSRPFSAIYVEGHLMHKTI